ncbi:PQQ-like beta-propeller repeat protein [Micromonospora sp. PLK6-60]|uniref:outer membrane protein assembly factor BamB family protein n=1 Tax=Micromonospora sp. PLK6-60 TaxID=2873383 RepID=UPI001CA731F5|nr:PQQ-binding-like beta-propeller repeat protein [Micromonospora sp. PLK6-60]MBY8873152.1 PQQ-like beta-propeller repeat protein [Micromonospora sp. PLK6-60]
MGLVRRRVAVAVVALLALAGSAVVIHRVLAPAEVSTVARGGWPAPVTPTVGVVGRLPAAPLIVDGRLRVYAAARQVYADQPADARARVTPFWSYRRWPARLAGVLAEETTVVSRWSDGKLVALDARTGRVVWRADGPTPDGDDRARRTGAATVWAPAGLAVGRGADGGPVLVVSGGGRARGYALADGRELWHADGDRSCRTDLGTTAAGQAVAVDACGGPPVVEFRDVTTGTVGLRWQPPGASAGTTVTPLGCLAPRSGCRALRTAGPGDGAGRGWLVGAGSPVAAPALDAEGRILAGELAVGGNGPVLTGWEARTGKERWRRGDLGPVRILAAQPGRLHVLTEARDLVTLDPVTGAERSRFPFTWSDEGFAYQPGMAYAADGYLAVERLREDATPDDDDQGWFLTPEPVLLAAT